VSDGVRAKLALVQPLLSAASLRVLRHPRKTDLYPEYLLTMHGISRAAVPLMQAALRRVVELHSASPTAELFSDYLRGHIPEEHGHAEWVLEDLEVIGFDRALALRRMPPPTVASLVGAQYYWIEHVHPIALLGYLAIMEANPPSLEAVAELAAATGFPMAAFRSMRLHARLDIEHRKDLYRAMDRLPLDVWGERLVGVSALHTAELLIQVLTDLVEGLERNVGVNGEICEY
jgi:hypothetical protein